jgi:hypothetical protein
VLLVRGAKELGAPGIVEYKGFVAYLAVGHVEASGAEAI